MEFVMIAGGIVLLLALVALIASLVCFYKVFYSPPRKALKEDEFDFPVGKEYEPFYDQMKKWTLEMRARKFERVEIKSFDGLSLRGKYFEYSPDAPLELMFHGYKGNMERDLCGGVNRCFAIGRNVLIVDHRASGESDGSVISFGVNESRDCVDWANFAVERFGKDVKIILTGISMGASTVMSATARELPENVVGVLADCGYSSAEEIIKKVIADMGLPPDLLYPFVKLGGKLFGKFNIDELPPIEAMKSCKIPVVFVHGENDGFVPYEMSVACFNACSAEKRIILVPEAEHGLAYPVDCEGYLVKLSQCFTELGIETSVMGSPM